MAELDALWQYQKEDMVVMRFENDMRKDPTRSKLIRLRNFVVEQQKELLSMEERSAQARTRLGDLTQEIARDESEVESGQEAFKSLDTASMEVVQSALREAHKLLEAIKLAEREVKKIQMDAANVDKKLKDIRDKVGKAHVQYNQLKEGYDQTFAEQTQELESLKKKRGEAGDGIDAAQMKRYEEVRQQCTPPLAKLQGDQCGGCNMSLPAVVVKRVKDGGGMVECENCGRILLLAQ